MISVIRREFKGPETYHLSQVIKSGWDVTGSYSEWEEILGVDRWWRVCPIILFPTNLWNLFQSVIAKEHSPRFHNAAHSVSPADYRNATQLVFAFIAWRLTGKFFHRFQFMLFFVTLHYSTWSIAKVGAFRRYRITKNMPLSQAQPTLKFYYDRLSKI